MPKRAKCPWCRCNQVKEELDVWPNGGRWVVVCLGCGAKGPPATGKDMPEAIRNARKAWDSAADTGAPND